MTTIMVGELQIDHERGVIYFHSSLELIKNGYCPTPLRICGLGNIKSPIGDRQIDITIRPLAIQDHVILEAKVVK